MSKIDGLPWQPSLANTTKDHVLFDELVVGHIERFDDDGPTYAYCCGERLGAFKTDAAAREAVIEALRSPVVMMKTADK